MEDQVTVEITHTAPPERVACGVVLGAVAEGVVAATVVRQRFSCGHGCGFVVNVN